MDEHDLAEQNRHLEIAVEHRTTIGVALGIIMARRNLSQDDAWALLTRISSMHERKVYDLAHQIASTRAVPALRRSGRGPTET